jgi:hypothetical protein
VTGVALTKGYDRSFALLAALALASALLGLLLPGIGSERAQQVEERARQAEGRDDKVLEEIAVGEL